MKNKSGSRFLLIGTCVVSMMLAQFVAAQTWSAAGPLPRGFHSAVLDPVTNKMIAFGGQPSGAITNGTQNLNDLWRLNLANMNWTQVKAKGTAPAPRIGHSAVYDSVSNRMIVFGGGEGRTSPCENDVWVLTNANGSGGATTWSKLNPSGSAPAPRMSHGAVYDPNTNSMIVFGGQDCFSTVYQDVWVLSNANGVSGTPTWTQLAPSGSGPGPVQVGQSLAYDSATNSLITFGGDGMGGRSNFVWLLSNANGTGGTPTWSQLSPTGTAPAARAFNTLVYDPATNHITIFGGQDTTGAIYSDTWVLSNANGTGGTPNWTQPPAGTYFPEARYIHTAVYNSTTNTMTVFGGQINHYYDTPSIYTGDVFVLSHANGQ